MAKINKYLTEWEENGLISSDNAKKILEYEKSKHKKPWIIYGFIILGIVIISIGIISLVAANWSSIPSAVKLILDFAVLILIAFAIYKSSGMNKPVIFDALASLFVFMCLASIGLISQIYHTGGQVYQALFLLAAVTVPVTLMSFKNFLPHLWTVVLLLAVILFSSVNLDYYEKSGLYFISLGILFSLPLSCVTLGNILSFRKITDKISMPFIIWSVIFYFSGIFVFDFVHSITEFTHGHIFNYGDGVSTAGFYIILNIFLVLSVITFWVKTNIAVRIKILATIMACFYCILMNLFIFSDFYSFEHYNISNYSNSGHLSFPLYTLFKFIGPAGTIISLFLFSFLFSSYDLKKLFNLMILMTGIRFLIIYFQVF